jgi:hypothetical protein
MNSYHLNSQTMAKLSGIRLDGKPEKSKQRNVGWSKPITKKAGLIPAVSAEPDLF